ncbi:MAG: lysoplasmalogenase [Treponema sp.]|jgi:uncharacterized membrane protein YhhN|nr:lysoplasmalogenase [Treponema sp.]
MTMVFLGIFAAAALTHLASLYFGNNPLRVLTKVCLLPPLLGLYLAGAEQPQAAAALGILLGWLGDILLLWIRRRLFFVLGLASFLLGHLAYISVFLSRVPALNLPVLALSGTTALIAAILGLGLIRPDRPLFIPAALYAIVLEAMSLCALQLALYRRDPPSLGILAGSLCFLLSDFLLAWHTFRTSSRIHYFMVMLSYIMAQFLIVRGLSS